MTSTQLSAPASLSGTWRPSEAVAVQAVRWSTLAIGVGLWELVCRTVLARNDYLAAPSVVVRDGLPAAFRASALGELGQTTLRFAIAFLVVAVVGVPLGLALGRLRAQVFLGTRDVVSVLYALPLAPFYPLFVLWLGLGNRSEIAFGVLHGIVPVLLVTMAAAAGVEATLITSSQAMGASRGQRLTSVVLPAALPETISALKIGAALSLLGVLLAELMISVDGVGTFIAQQITNRHAAQLDAMVLVVCVGAVAVNTLLAAVERRTAAWRPAG